jgi:hypothetical protein
MTDDHRDEAELDGAEPLSPNDFKRIQNVLKVTGRFTTKSVLDLGKWDTLTRLKTTLGEAMAAPSLKEQRRLYKTIVANCETAVSQYERRLKRPDCTVEARELNLEKKIRIEALRFVVAKLYDSADGSPRKTAAIFQRFLMDEILKEVEELSNQLDVRLRNIKLKIRMVKLMSPDKQARGQSDLDAMKRSARELAADLLKKEIAFSVGLEILGMLDSQFAEGNLSRDTMTGQVRHDTGQVSHIRKTGRIKTE